MRYQFDNFVVDEENFCLTQNGSRIALEPKSLRVLIQLIRAPGKLVSKNALLEEVWSGTFVEETTLTRAVALLRKQLGDDPRKPRFIETVPTMGYRFIALVRELTSAELAPFPVTTNAKPAAHSGSPHLLWICTVSTFLLIGAAIAWIVRHQSPQPIHSLAVLPLRGPSDPGTEYFQDGMTEELIAELSTIPGLRVASHNAVMQWKDSHDSLASIAHSLGVEAVVTGSVRRSKDKAQLDLRLFDARSNRELWQAQVSDSATNVIALQQNAVREIADHTLIPLSAATLAGFNKQQKVDPAAFDGYLQGRYLLSKRDVERAVPLFQRAIVLDPGYARAWAGLASSLADSAMGSKDPLDGPAREAIAAANHAIELDPLNGEAWAVRGMVAFNWQWDWKTAEQDLQRAITLSPSDSIPELQYATFLSLVGRSNEAVGHMKQALELDPLSFFNVRHMGSVYYWTRQYDQSLDFFKRAQEMEPDLVSFIEPWESKAYEMKGMPGEAMAADLRILTPSDPSGWRPRLVAAYQSGNRTTYWETKLKMLQAFSNQACTSFEIAADYSRLGRNKEALDWLDRALNERCFLVGTVKADPIFDGLRAEPRYEAVLRRVNLNE